MSEFEPRGEQGPEQNAELAEAAREALRNIERGAEVVAENTAEKIEAAREVIERQTEAPKAPTVEREKVRAHVPTRFDKRQAYWRTVRAMQRRLKPASRRFSEIIHTPAIETMSEVAGKTVFRPSVTLGASSTALVVGAFFYITAKTYGFPLSGSEFVVSLLVGAVLGLAIEGLSKLFRR